MRHSISIPLALYPSTSARSDPTSSVPRRPSSRGAASRRRPRGATVNGSDGDARRGTRLHGDREARLHGACFGERSLLSPPLPPPCNTETGHSRPQDMSSKFNCETASRRWFGPHCRVRCRSPGYFESQSPVCRTTEGARPVHLADGSLALAFAQASHEQIPPRKLC